MERSQSGIARAETAEETRRFFRAVVFESVSTAARESRARALVENAVHVERFGVLETFKKLASIRRTDPLLGDTVELACPTITSCWLARQQGITLRNFQNEQQAIEW